MTAFDLKILRKREIKNFFFENFYVIVIHISNEMITVFIFYEVASSRLN